MIPLRKHLLSTLGRTILESHERFEILSGASDQLASIRFDRAVFLVNIQSLWAVEGEKGLEKFTHRGNLKEAVQKAVAEFRRINNRDDFQARMQVYVVLGKHDQLIPEEYWKEFISHLGFGVLS